MGVIGVPVECLDLAYPHVAYAITKVREKQPRCPTPEKVYQALLDKTMQLLLVVQDDQTVKATAVTEIETDGGNKVCRVVALHGEDMSEWFDDLVYHVEQFARQNDCTHLELQGRLGWQKMFKQNGFQTEAVIMRREI
ncbi:MAG: hypothetical protein JAY60_18570 [Candidatus Thiodiazotropha weberae]|nr:hypothetical protein [Candidatus Thiodiazotropha weberae]